MESVARGRQQPEAWWEGPGSGQEGVWSLRATDPAWIYTCEQASPTRVGTPNAARCSGRPAAAHGYCVRVNSTEVRAGKQVSHATGSGIRSQARLTPEQRGFELHRFTATCIFFSVAMPAAQRELRLAEAADSGPRAGRPLGRCSVHLQLQWGPPSRAHIFLRVKCASAQ